MSKFYGKLGFAKAVETSPGIWEDEIVEKYYKGDIIKYSRRWEHGESANDNLNVSDRISIVADSFAVNNVYCMKYIELWGSLWKITEVSIDRPRIVLSIGGLYNGEQT